MRLIVAVTVLLLLASPAAAADPGAGRAHQAEGDRLRAQGQYQEALAEYQAELAASGPNAETWKRIGWSLRSLHRTPEAVEALRTASRIDPKDREARDDLAALELSRGLTARAWLGGTEPGTSKQAVEGQLRYAGFDRLELQAGAGWSDNIFYESAKGYATAYFFHAPGSYLKGDLSPTDPRPIRTPTTWSHASRSRSPTASAERSGPGWPTSSSRPTSTTTSRPGS
jgi:tetratricopeptide (TPR) repeat protein